MNLLLLEKKDLIQTDTAVISGRRFDHFHKIVKIKKDQILDVGMINGMLGKGIVTSIDESSITVKAELNCPPPPANPITLLLALPRPLMLKRILQTTTALGIKQIHLINSCRVEKSYWNSSDLSQETIHHQLILGLEQARDTVLPAIHFHKQFGVFIQNKLPELSETKHALLAHPGDYQACPANIDDDVVLAIGPEGGFIDDEVAKFIKAGFKPVQIGTRVLRVEAAVTALLGRLSAI